MSLEKQERIVFDFINKSGLKGVSVNDILDMLDKVPASPLQRRKDDRVHHTTAIARISAIRKKLGDHVINRVTVNGHTRYYPEGIEVEIKRKTLADPEKIKQIQKIRKITGFGKTLCGYLLVMYDRPSFSKLSADELAEASLIYNGKSPKLDVLRAQIWNIRKKFPDMLMDTKKPWAGYQLTHQGREFIKEILEDGPTTT